MKSGGLCGAVQKNAIGPVGREAPASDKKRRLRRAPSGARRTQTPPVALAARTKRGQNPFPLNTAAGRRRNRAAFSLYVAMNVARGVTIIDDAELQEIYLRELFDAHDWIEQEIFREGRHFTRAQLEAMAAGA